MDEEKTSRKIEFSEEALRRGANTSGVILMGAGIIGALIDPKPAMHELYLALLGLLFYLGSTFYYRETKT